MALVEVVFVVDEIDLKACLRYGGHLDDERVVGFVDDEVDARKTNDLVQLSAALVDVAPFGHERAYLATAFLNLARQVAAHQRELGFGYVGCNFLIDE